MSLGIWQGIAAYTIWGLFPIYWKLFHGVPALEVLAHRMTWSFMALLLLISTRHPRALPALLRVRPRVLALYSVAAVLIGFNWFFYVWAVNAGFVIEASLGYFMTPLVNVVLGVLVFRERLSAAQWSAVAIAAAGVVYLTVEYGSLPWIALGLAVTFGSYGLAKKKATLPPVDGLLLETSILLIPALVYLASVHASGHGVFFTSARLAVLLLVSGVITVAPLLLFASSVRLVPLSIVGILQYISPSIQLALGVLMFHESFTRIQLAGFTCVWAALVIFGLDGLRARQRSVPVRTSLME